MSNPTLLASAPTLEAIRECITRFYMGTAIKLESVATKQWNVIRSSDGKYLDGVTVVQSRGRYRFEMI